MGGDTDRDMNLAAECLVAMSSGQLFDKSRFLLNGDQSQLQLQRGPENPPVSDSLFMIARILTDLTRIKQEPVPNIDDDITHPFADRLNDKGTTPTFQLQPDNLSIKREPQELEIKKATTQPGSASQAKKIHQCKYAGCDKSYSKSSHLKAHQRSHTGKFLSNCF